MHAMRRPLGRIWTVLALTVMLSACGSGATTGNTLPVSARTIPLPTATATATPLPPIPLPWKTLAVPAVPSSYGSRALTVAPSNGDIAYICSAPTGGIKDGQPRAWHTSDRGAHWIRGADIPVARDENMCQIVVDMTHPATAVAVLQWMPRGAGGGPSIQDSLCYLTTDMGMTWRHLATPQPFIVTALGSHGGVTYAVRQVLDGNGAQSRLWASTDGMNTWRRVDMDIPDAVADAWIASGNAPILAESDTGDGPRYLWQSHDGGQHWSQIVPPARTAAIANATTALSVVPMPSHLPLRPLAAGWGTKDEYIVQASSDGASWSICQSYYEVTDPRGSPNQLQCSNNGGQTWSVRTGPNMLRNQDGSVARAEIIGIAHDGTVLAIEYDDATNGSLLYQLPEGATSWRSRGPVGAFPVYYSPSPDGDILWAMGFAGGFVARY